MKVKILLQKLAKLNSMGGNCCIYSFVNISRNRSSIFHLLHPFCFPHYINLANILFAVTLQRPFLCHSYYHKLFLLSYDFLLSCLSFSFSASGHCTYSCHHLSLWIISTLHLQCYLESIYSLRSNSSWAFFFHLSSFPQTLLPVCVDLFPFLIYLSSFLTSKENQIVPDVSGAVTGRREPCDIVTPPCVCPLWSRASKLLIIWHIKLSIIPVN